MPSLNIKPRELVPVVVVRREFGVSEMSIFRWLNDASLNFPRPILIRNRRYFWRSEIERFKDRMAGASVSKGVEPPNPYRRPAKSRARVGGAMP